MMPVKTAVSNAYPNPDNDTARIGFGAQWDVINELCQAPEIDLASAATIDIGGQATTKIRVTGTAGVNSFGTNYRGPILIRFAAALVLTHNATSMILPGGANITTTAGGICIAYPKATSGTVDGWIVAFSSDYIAAYAAAQAASQAGSKLPLTGGTLTGALSGTSGAFSGALSGLTVTQTSDERKKENWKPLPADILDALADIELSGLFDWVDGGSGIGVGAQSFEKILSAAVHTDDEGNKTVNYGAAALVLCVELARALRRLK